MHENQYFRPKLCFSYSWRLDTLKELWLGLPVLSYMNCKEASQVFFACCFMNKGVYDAYQQEVTVSSFV